MHQNIDSATKSTRTTYYESGTVSGSCRGSAEYLVSVNDISGLVAGSFEYKNYCSGGSVVSGEINITALVNPSTNELVSFTLSFNELTDGNVTLDGNISMSISGDEAEISMDAYVSKQSTGQVNWCRDYEIRLQNQGSYVEIAISGEFYYSDYGHVTLSTDQAFIVYDYDDYPSSGILRVSGANNTKARLVTISDSIFYIEADTTGDDIYNWNSGYYFWSDV